jgi:hypothetical protein
VSDHPNIKLLYSGSLDSDGFETSDGGFGHQPNDVAHVLKHADGMVPVASHRSVAIHAGMDEGT